jgi:hypothetical protein
MTRLSLFILSFGLVYCSLSLAQENIPLYHMLGVPQSNNMNPAFQPGCNFYIGSSYINFNIGSKPLRVNDVLFYNATIDSLITPLHRLANKDAFLAKLKPINTIGFESSINFLSFGFRVANTAYITFDVNDKVFSIFDYPADFAKTLLKGFPANQSYNWKNLGISSSYYREYALGFSNQFSDDLTLGIKGKLLFGKANLYTDNKDMYMYTDMSQWNLRTNIDVHSSLPMVEFSYDSLNRIKYDDIRTQSSSSDIRNAIFNRRNWGLGVDLGAVYKLSEKIQLSASLVDLGYIKWRSYLNGAKLQGEYKFTGVEFNSLDKDTIMQAITSIEDTLKDKFYKAGNNPYITSLAPKLYIGAAYNVTNWFKLGMVSRTMFYRNTINPEITFSANVMPINLLSASVTYSVLNNKAQNLGVGLGLKFFAWQLYFVSEQIPLVYSKKSYLPYQTTGVNFRFGMNLLFGCQKQKKLEKDQPIIE